MNTTRNTLATLRRALLRSHHYAEDTATSDAILDAYVLVATGRTAEAAEKMAKVDGLPTWVADELDLFFAEALGQ